MVGSAIVRTLLQNGQRNLITRSRSELDLTDQSEVRAFLKSEKPDEIYLAAAKVGGIHANNTGAHAFSTEGVWDIAYSEPRQSGMTSANLQEPFELFTESDANHYWHQYDLATEIYKLWVQIYSLLGSVEDAQAKVLERLSVDHSFMKKSYWLNTGDPINDAASLARSFDVAMGDFKSSYKPVCQRTLNYWGNRHLGGTGIQPYVPSHTDPVVQLNTSAPCSSGLFQMEWVDPSMVKKLRDKNADYPGLLLWMNWSIPQKNYWNVDFPILMNHESPQGTLRTTISVQGDPANKPAVWPNPTPKFQVRQFP